MTIQSVQQFSTSEGSNTDINGVNINTGWPPQNVGIAVRTLMALLGSSLQPLAMSLTNNTAVTLTAAQASAQFINFTGVLAADCAVTLPAAAFYGFAVNKTTGGHNVVLKTAAAGSTTATLKGSDGLYLYAIDATGNVSVVTCLGAPLATSPVTASTTNTVTNKIAITIDGTTYYLLASTSGT